MIGLAPNVYDAVNTRLRGAAKTVPSLGAEPGRGARTEWRLAADARFSARAGSTPVMCHEKFPIREIQRVAGAWR